MITERGTDWRNRQGKERPGEYVLDEKKKLAEEEGG